MQKKFTRLICLLLAFVLCAGLLGTGYSAAAAGLASPMTAEMYALLDDIVQAVSNWETEVDLSPYSLSNAQVNRVEDEFFVTHPRFFYYVSYNDAIRDNKLHLHYSGDTLGFRKEDVPVYEAAVQKALDTAIKPGMNALAIMLALHDYLCAVAEYDDPAAESDELCRGHTAYGALVEGRALCQGYAMAYADLLQRCGIECRVVRAFEMDHGWTMVKLGGLWYHIDVTWDDDKTPQPKHKYFLNSDYQISADHYGWEQYEYCISHDFDDSQVQKMSGPFFFTSGTECYSFLYNKAAKGFDLVRWDWVSNTLNWVKTIEGTWPFLNEPGYHYAECYSNIIMRDGLLYFNGPETLYCYDPATDALTSQGVSTKGNGYLYGLFWNGDQVYCYVGFDANMDEEDMLVMHIPDDFFRNTHTHSLSYIAAKNASCTQSGNIVCWYCAECGQYFRDQAGTSLISGNDWYIPATGHRLTGYPYVAPTCTEDGSVAYWYCSECGYFYFDSACTRMIVDDSWRLPATGHKLTAHPYVAPTAAKSGNSAYWSCSECGKFYSDAAGTHEIARSSWILPATSGSSGSVVLSNAVGAAGGTVQMTLDLKDNPGINTLRLSVGYDSRYLKLVSVSDKGLLGNAVMDPGYTVNPYGLFWSNGTQTQNYTVNGTVLTLTFEVKGNAPKGQYPVTLTFEEAYNAATEYIILTAVSGSVTVSNGLLGDVNSDGDVNSKDSIVFSRYLARWSGVTINEAVADLNRDGFVNAKDCIILDRHLAKWTGYETFPYAG